MKTLLLFFFLYVSLASSDMSIIRYDETHGIRWRTDNEVMDLYEAWLVEHGKSYNGLGEKDKRFEIFKDNLRYIDEQNSVANRTYKLGLNRFADLTNDEYRSMYLGTKTDAMRRFSRSPSDRYLPKAGNSLPDSVDWRKEGAVVPVKDQGSCGKLFCFL